MPKIGHVFAYGVLGVAVLSAATPTRAAMVEMPSALDNTLYESATGHLSNGAGQHFFAGRTSTTSGGAIRRGLVWFDIETSIPPGATVTNAVLRLHMSRTITGSQNVSLHRATASWGEGASAAPGEEGGGATAQSGDATWQHRFHDTNFWSTAGGDFDPGALAVTAISGIGFYEWSSSSLIEHIQDIVDGEVDNAGFMLVGNETTAATSKRFDTRENTVSANRPVLIVGYEEPTGELEGDITHTARLLPEFEVPPVTNAFVGAGGFAYDRSTRELKVFVIHNVDDMTAAHIHGPAPTGANAGIVFTLSDDLHIRDTFTLTAQQEQDLLDGLYYVNIHNSEFPAGAIRGQIVVDDQYRAVLLGEEEVPPADNDFFGIALFAYDRPTRTLDYFMVHDVTDATAAHIHGFAPVGENAGIVIDLGTGASPIRGTVTLDASLEAALRIEHLYVNVHNPAFPAGAIRGQIEPNDPFETITHTADLTPDQEVPPVDNDFSGAGLFTLDRATGRLRYFISHDVTNATAAHIHGPAASGANAGVRIDFGIPTSPIAGTIMLTPGQADELWQGLWYVNVHNPDFPAGAIRGQALVRHDFAARLTGRSETPPRTVAEAGAAMFDYDHATRELTYRIVHEVREPTAAHIHGPAVEGVPAPILHDLGDTASPMTGTLVLTPADAFNLHKGRLFVNVHSATYPTGAIRGQLQPLDPVLDATLTATLTPDQETPPVTNAFNATAVLRYDRASRLLSWFVEHNVHDMTAAHIHGPAALGESAGIVFDMGPPSHPVIEGNRVLTIGQERELLNGLYYINIHNPDFPAGAIRGQILSGDRFHATLQGRQETPAVATRATGVGVFSYDNPTRTLAWRIEHGVADATAAHIHGPSLPGEPAGIVIDFGSAVSPITGSVQLTAHQEFELLNGLYFVNVHSPAYPPGELRGQIQGVDPLPAHTHASVLDGDQAVPPVGNDFSGVGLFAYDYLSRILHLEVHHSVTDAVAVHLHGPAGPGTNAAVVLTLDSPRSPIRESLTLTQGQDHDFRAGHWYVNVQNPDFPAGALRGQILPSARLHAVIEGRQQETPGPVTTAARGLGVFLFEPATAELVYHIEHSVTNASVAHIHGPAPPGVAAPPVFDIPHESPITGSTNLSPQAVIELFQGQYYVNVHSPAYPPGEIRGQIWPSFPDSTGSGIDDFWLADHGLVPGAFDPSEDLDGDGFSVMEEYIADTDPLSPESFPRLVDIAQDTENLLSFPTSAFRWYWVEITTNLLEIVWAPVQSGPFRGVGGLMTVPLGDDAPSAFYRLRIMRQPTF